MKKLAILLTGLLSLAPVPLVAQDNLNTRERLDTFRGLDANGDGWVSKAEVAPRRKVAAAFEKADRDRDGRLSFAEFETIALNRSDQPGRFRNPDRG